MTQINLKRFFWGWIVGLLLGKWLIDLSSFVRFRELLFLFEPPIFSGLLLLRPSSIFTSKRMGVRTQFATIFMFRKPLKCLD